jgi:F-type H+-transporting ATPase subunit c
MAQQIDPSLIKGLTIGLGAIGPAIGVGIIGAAVVSAVGRNPEVQGKVLTMALVMVGLVDAYFAFVLLILFTTHG